MGKHFGVILLVDNYIVGSIIYAVSIGRFCVIYTIGLTRFYEKYFEEQDIPQKKGRSDNYHGGSVWQTFEEASKYPTEGYSVYGILANWDTDTEPSACGASWHDLLIDAPLVKLFRAMPEEMTKVG